MKHLVRIRVFILRKPAIKAHHQRVAFRNDAFKRSTEPAKTKRLYKRIIESNCLERVGHVIIIFISKDNISSQIRIHY